MLIALSVEKLWYINVCVFLSVVGYISGDKGLITVDMFDIVSLLTVISSLSCLLA